MRHTLLYTASLLLGMASLFTSCRETADDTLNPDAREGYEKYIDNNTYAHQFQQIWSGMNDRYSFWDVDPTNWQAMYKNYMPKFEQLDKQLKDADPDEQPEAYAEAHETFVEYYRDIFKDIVDSHLTLQFIDPYYAVIGSIYDNLEVISPADMRWQKDDYKSQDLFASTSYARKLASALRNMPSQGHTLQHFEEFDLAEDNWGIFAIIDNIAYFQFSGFSLSSSGGMEQFTQAYVHFLDYAKSDACRGIIIDTRGNGGGSMADLAYVISPFIGEPLTPAQQRNKVGLGRNEFSPWYDFSAVPNDEAVAANIAQRLGLSEEQQELLLGTAYARPIVALASSNSISMGEITPGFIKAMPNGTLIGTTTWGAHGPLSPNATSGFYTGCFGNNALDNTINDFKAIYSEIANDEELGDNERQEKLDSLELDYAKGLVNALTYYVYTSDQVTRWTDGGILEGKGIEPNIRVEQDFDAFNNQAIDKQLNAALDYFKN